MREILNKFIQTFTYTPEGKENYLQILLTKKESTMYSIICLVFGAFLLLVGFYNYFITDLILYLIVVQCYGYAYILTEPAIMGAINIEAHFTRYAFLYFFLVCFTVILACICNKYGDNFVSALLLSCILNQQYISYFKEQKSVFYPIILTIFSGMLLTFVFNDLISPFLFCITGVSLLFTVFNNSSYINPKKEDIMEYEITQFIYILVFIVSFVIHLRLIDIKTYSKRIRAIKMKFRKSRAVLTGRVDNSTVDVHETFEKENEKVYKSRVKKNNK